jgi:hypothetical protein
VDIAIERLNNKKEIWDEFIGNCDSGTVFHTSKWLETICKYDNFTLEMLGGYKGQKLVGIFPIFIKKGKWINSAFSPPPISLTPYGGPLFDIKNTNQDKRESLQFSFIHAVDRYLSGEKINHMNFITTFPFEDVRLFMWHRYAASPKYTYIANLITSKDTLWQTLGKNKRSKIRKGQENKSITIKSLSPSGEFIDMFWDLWEKTHKRSNIKVPLIKKLLKDIIFMLYPDNLAILAGYYESEIAAINLYPHSNNKRIHYWLGASDSNFWKYHVPDLLQWRGIQFAIENGFATMDLVGANVPSIAKFKVGFNPVVKVYYQIEKLDSLPFNLLDKTYHVLKGRLFRLLE